MCLKLIQEDSDGIWNEITNPAYSPVLRKPNHYQSRIQFFIAWMTSKLTTGNTYVLKERDARGVVVALYVLDPGRTRPMVSPDGQVYYECTPYDVIGLGTPILVPSTEIIHDVYIAPYHPLVGLPPIYAAGMVIAHGLQILNNTTTLFQNGSQPGGVLTAPGVISEANAKRVQEWWDSNFSGSDNIGKVAVLSDGLKYERMGLSAVETDVIKQLNWDDERICSVYHVPGYMVGVGQAPAYNNVEALNQQYYSQCLQIHIESIELLLDEGLKFDAVTTVEFDVERGLLRMDTATKMKTATDGVRGGIYTPNEARAMFNKPPLKGGDTVFMQEQDHSLQALAARDAGPDPFGKAKPPPPAAPMPVAPIKDDLEAILAKLVQPKAASVDVDETDDWIACLEKEWSA